MRIQCVMMSSVTDKLLSGRPRPVCFLPQKVVSCSDWQVSHVANDKQCYMLSAAVRRPSWRVNCTGFTQLMRLLLHEHELWTHNNLSTSVLTVIFHWERGSAASPSVFFFSHVLEQKLWQKVAKFFQRPDVLLVTKMTISKHWTENTALTPTWIPLYHHSDTSITNLRPLLYNIQYTTNVHR